MGEPTPLATLRRRLGDRAYNALMRAGIDTVEALRRTPEGDLLAIRGFGVGCLEVVYDTLEALGSVDHDVETAGGGAALPAIGLGGEVRRGAAVDDAGP